MRLLQGIEPWHIPSTEFQSPCSQIWNVLSRCRPSTADPTMKFADEIQFEDGHICEVVHMNLKSQSYDRGRCSAKQEKGLHYFHRLYAKAMGL
jgi:hypothetical protein